MANVRRERAPAVAGFVDTAAPIVVRNEGLTARAALEALGRLPPGGRIFVFSKGAVDLGDVVAWGLEHTGPADVLLSTWAIGADETKRLRRLLDSCAIRRLRLLVDCSFPSRQPAYTALLRASFGPDVLRLAVVHAKVGTLLSVDGRWSVVIKSSGNLNHNKRVEIHEIEDNAALAGFINSTLGEWFRGSGADDFDVAPSEHRRRFDAWHADEQREVGPVSAPVATAAAPGRALKPTAPDAAFFGDGWADTDLRRVGLSYVR